MPFYQHRRSKVIVHEYLPPLLRGPRRGKRKRTITLQRATSASWQSAVPRPCQNESPIRSSFAARSINLLAFFPVTLDPQDLRVPRVITSGFVTPFRPYFMEKPDETYEKRVHVQFIKKLERHSDVKVRKVEIKVASSMTKSFLITCLNYA